ncbi:trypsin-like peptidase domain-containing protein [Bacteroidales bacterium OttesenSCG-928-B11]|nr:trypsin-like peptidase domain-containing protein [Bacteroidales bacterium OttesenSCG-928-B11]MDL2325810.1 trypsin-like peptidase domain-containing protein [Bacteroidales bacterium OttesenSCG-928-A14]
MTRKSIIKVFIISVLTVTSLTSCAQNQPAEEPPKIINVQTNYVDLTYAAEKSVNAVVHIKTEFMRKNSFFDDFFGSGFLEQFFGISSQYPVVAAGSGVIIDPNGYIVTNNHVVAEANKITVTLNDKKEYEATIVGTDPTTDLALIKINAKDLPYLTFANSDDVRIGEAVLAVGNPFNLTSTVTAGIVSAKARNLNILGEQSSVESFIQTDAAVNQGNSGGALVNSSGQLIGINTAIASGNGYFTGYSFAIPANIAKKVILDLKEYGTVKRAYLGVMVMEVTYKMAEELNLEKVQGVYVTEVTPNGAAESAGLKVGDIILSVGNHTLSSMSELREAMIQYSPNETVSVKYLRNHVEHTKDIKLK